MKTNYLKASLLALAVMTACTEMEISNESQDFINNGLLQELSITGKDFQFDDMTRSSVTIGENGASFTWDEDDVIGIFPNTGDQVSFAMAQGAGTQTATFSGGGWALKSSAKYAAYYPHVYENRDLTAIPVSYVGQTQNGNGNTDHIGAYDFMAAGVSTPENGAVAFDMQHLGALVQLNITVPEPSTLSKVVLNSAAKFIETGTIDLTAETPSITAVTQSNALEIALNNVVTTAANETVTVYYIIAPVDLTDDKPAVIVHFKDKATNAIKIKGKNFVAGKVYRLDATLKTPSDYIDEYGVNHGKGVNIDGIVWAPVNCGYHKEDFKYGKLYQWGRKYGQGYDGELRDLDNHNIGEYVDAETPLISNGPVSLDTGELRMNEKYFYLAATEYPYDWYTPRRSDLWNSGTEEEPKKTEYDPCPASWRVPTHSEAYELKINSSSWTTNDAGQIGYYFSGISIYSEDILSIFFPAAGHRNENTGIADDRGYDGAYWVSKRTNYGDPYRLYFRKGSIIMNALAGSAYGYSVRCVQE